MQGINQIKSANAQAVSHNVRQRELRNVLGVVRAHLENGDPVEAESVLKTYQPATPEVRREIEKLQEEISLGTNERAITLVGILQDHA